MSDLTKSVMKSLLYNYEDTGFQFPNMILKLKMSGIELASVNLLRAWCQRAISKSSLIRLFSEDFVLRQSANFVS